MLSNRSLLLIAASAIFVVGCSSEPVDPDNGTVPPQPPTYEGPSSVDDPTCQQPLAFCGDLLVPADFKGTPRSLAIALYAKVPPAGPPDAVIAEIMKPAIGPSQRFPIVVEPVVVTGDYYVWLNLYVEGGGMFIPVNGVDYTGVTEMLLKFDGNDGKPSSFGEILVAPAEGF